jgi:autonomous glycyl radical cofactor GrcA
MATVNHLTDEILIEIFGFLSPRMVKNCNLVCKRWDDIISNSRVLMDQYKVCLRQTDVEDKEVTRKIQRMVLQDVNKLDMAPRFELHTLKIDIDIIWHVVKQFDLIRALNCLQSLKFLKIKFMNKIVIDNFQKARINLDKLITSSSIVHIFECSTLTFLEMDWESELNMDRQIIALEFLNQQQNLKELILNGYDFDDFFSSPVLQHFAPKFSLEKFNYTIYNAIIERNEELIFFLKSQSRTLNSLRLNFRVDVNSFQQIFTCVFNNMLELKHFDMFLTVSSFDDDNFMPAIPTYVTKSITHFGYGAIYRPLDDHKTFFDTFRSIKHLYLWTEIEPKDELLEYISTTKIELESLGITIFYLDSVNMSRIFFPNLRKFSVSYLQCADNSYILSCKNEKILCLFIMRHAKTLEEITINNSDITKLTIDAISKCKNLKYLEVSFEFQQRNGELDISSHMSSDTLKALKNIPSKYNRLTIKLSRYEFSTPYKFPEDEIFWNALFA